MNAPWRMMVLSFETFNRSYLRHFIRSSSENPRDESRGHKIIRAAGTSASVLSKMPLGMTDMVTSDFNPGELGMTDVVTSDFIRRVVPLALLLIGHIYASETDRISNFSL